MDDEIVDVVEADDLDGIPLATRGRGNRVSAHYRPHQGGGVIRVEDGRRPEFWAEIHLDRAMLQALLTKTPH